MGDVIRKHAAVEQIFGDVSRTMTNAAAHGGRWAQLASERLAGTVALIATTTEEHDAAAREATGAVAALAAANRTADHLIGQCHDELWNAAGRPGNDTGLALIFPGGISCYTEGSAADQPERMDLLARRLESVAVAKVDPVLQPQLAARVREQTAALRLAAEAARAPQARLRVAARTRTAVGRNAQVQLAHLKRVYKAAGFSETEIHAVIPSRPAAPRGTAEVPSPAPPVPTPPAPAPTLGPNG